MPGIRYHLMHPTELPYEVRIGAPGKLRLEPCLGFPSLGSEPATLGPHKAVRTVLSRSSLEEPRSASERLSSPHSGHQVGG